MSEWVSVAAVASIAEGEMLAATVGGDAEIAIYNVAGRFYATDNICTHAYANLTDGFLEDEQVECPLHGGRFDVTTGKGLCSPITCDVRTYPVRVLGTEIQVCISTIGDASTA
jgi:nitrite reductase/ring-hydroxylating ferredoxin subunit